LPFLGCKNSGVGAEQREPPPFYFTFLIEEAARIFFKLLNEFQRKIYACIRGSTKRKKIGVGAPSAKS
jgi:hypothetical protein